MEIREYFLSFSLYSQVHSFQLCRWRIRLSREEVSLARESRMTLSLRWMCMQRTTFHRPVFFLSLSLSFIFSLVSLRVFLFFFFSHVSSKHRTRKVVQRTSLFPEETRKICHHRVDRIVRIFNLAKRSFEESTYGGGEACFLSTSRYDVKRPHLVWLVFWTTPTRNPRACH